MQKPFVLNKQALFQFTTSAFILSPLAFLWLEGLEGVFPSSGKSESKSTGDNKGKEKEKEKEKGEKGKLNVRNTIAKIVVDQVLGGALNTVAFIVVMGALRGEGYEGIKGEVLNVCFFFLSFYLSPSPRLDSGQCDEIDEK